MVLPRIGHVVFHDAAFRTGPILRCRESRNQQESRQCKEYLFHDILLLFGGKDTKIFHIINDVIKTFSYLCGVIGCLTC
jgi:hypothetical protein